MAREQFSSTFGVMLAASGAAVGLGNIWSFPTQAATYGGGAFLLVYLLLVLGLAYPMLVVELTLGRAGQRNPVDMLKHLAPPALRGMVGWIGYLGMLVPCLVLSFYAIVAGWFISFMLAPLAELGGLTGLSEWLETFSVSRNLCMAGVFYGLTVFIVQQGIGQGIERWSKRLMPLLILIFVALFIYLLSQPGAQAGLAHYLVPDLAKTLDSQLIISAMGQAFFSLTIGGCSMLLYGSYLPQSAHLPRTALQVSLVDTAVAFIAGLVIIPAMYVAQAKGVVIYNEAGLLHSADTLVFTVLPELFDTMGSIGIVISGLFFLLMTVAALTSSISMLEVPVAFGLERSRYSRRTLSWIFGGIIALISAGICLDFEVGFPGVITFSTQYLQPFVALLFCLFGGWVWHRHSLIKELQAGNPQLTQGLFWKIWPWYVRFICPVLVMVIWWQGMA